MDGRELTSRLSASVLLFLKVALPENMLVPCPGSMQGVLSYTFATLLSYFAMKQTSMNHPSPPTVFFGYFI